MGYSPGRIRQDSNEVSQRLLRTTELSDDRTRTTKEPRSPKVFFFFAMLMKIEVKGEASKAQHLRVSETPEAHCAKMPKSIQLRAFGGTGEPCIFLDRDA